MLSRKRKIEEIDVDITREEEVEQIRKKIRMPVNPFKLLPQGELPKKEEIRKLYLDFSKSTNARYLEVLKYLFYDKEVFGDTVCILENEKSRMWTRRMTSRDDEYLSPYYWTHDIYIGRGIYGGRADEYSYEFALDTQEYKSLEEEITKRENEIDELLEMYMNTNDESERKKIDEMISKTENDSIEMQGKLKKMVSQARKIGSDKLCRVVNMKKGIKVRALSNKYEGNIYDTPNSYNEAIENCLKANPNSKYLISPIVYTVYEHGIEGGPEKSASHANVLILDISGRQVRIERYEPHGGETGLDSHRFLDDSIKRFLDNVPYLKKKGYIYYKPQDYCQTEGMQVAENVRDCSDILKELLKNKNGFCVLWSIVYMYMRVHPKTQDMDRKTLASVSSNLILNDPSLCEKVAKFAYYMLEPKYIFGRHIKSL